MFIKQFRTHQVRVADPLHPGKRVFEERLIATGGTSISHGGKTFKADEDGWFDLPDEVGAFFLSFRAPRGEQFFTPEQVDEQVRLGTVGQDAVSEVPTPTAPKGRSSR